MTYSPSYDLPASFDNWLTNPPAYTEEQDEKFVIEFGNDDEWQTQDFDGTRSEALKQSKKLSQRFGFARLIDEDGNEVESF